ncbi:MAG TPA: diacylglycerol kinase family protein [Anaerolineales bacterium]|nr:diacylglycerol kinase family protein [Anaerolineales bacterium]
MEAHLIFNPNSGGAEDLSPEALSEALRKVGYEPVYRATSSEKDLGQALKDVEGLIVVAGGDGTVRAVVTRMVGKNIPIAPLPLGTANNIAGSLGLEGGPLDIIPRLEDPLKRSFDVGRVRAPWGEDYFLEAAGIGFYADALRSYDPEKGKSVLRSIVSFSETLNDHQPCTMRIRADDRELTGEYFMIEALNTPSFGPWLRMAPDADVSDGKLNIVAIKEDLSKNILGYLRDIMENGGRSPEFEIQTARQLVIEWQDFTMHVDAEVRPVPTRRPADKNPAAGARPSIEQRETQQVTIDLLPGAIEFWLPEPVVGDGMLKVEESRAQADANAGAVTSNVNLQTGIL